jgi:excisionase family DNA binding protein
VINPILVQLTALRAQTAASLAVLDATISTIAANSETEADPLLDLKSAEKAYGIPASTLRTWIQSGRLTAYAGERGKFRFRRSAMMEAVEAQEYRPPVKFETTDDPLRLALASGDLEAAE